MESRADFRLQKFEDYRDAIASNPLGDKSNRFERPIHGDGEYVKSVVYGVSRHSDGTFYWKCLNSGATQAKQEEALLKIGNHLSELVEKMVQGSGRGPTEVRKEIFPHLEMGRLGVRVEWIKPGYTQWRSFSHLIEFAEVEAVGELLYFAGLESYTWDELNGHRHRSRPRPVQSSGDTRNRRITAS